jgi:hypothetical protein
VKSELFINASGASPVLLIGEDGGTGEVAGAESELSSLTLGTFLVGTAGVTLTLNSTAIETSRK